MRLTTGEYVNSLSILKSNKTKYWFINKTMEYTVRGDGGAVANKTLGLNLNNNNNSWQTVWQQSGCVSLDYLYVTKHPNFKIYFTACMDCLPTVVTSPAQHGLLDSDLQCTCQGF